MEIVLGHQIQNQRAVPQGRDQIIEEGRGIIIPGQEIIVAFRLGSEDDKMEHQEKDGQRHAEQLGGMILPDKQPEEAKGIDGDRDTDRNGKAPLNGAEKLTGERINQMNGQLGSEGHHRLRENPGRIPAPPDGKDASSDGQADHIIQIIDDNRNHLCVENQEGGKDGREKTDPAPTFFLVHSVYPLPVFECYIAVG